MEFGKERVWKINVGYFSYIFESDVIFLHGRRNVAASLHVGLCMCVCTCLPSVVARTNSCKNVVLWVVVARLQGSISYFLVARSLQMNAEAASDVDPKY